MDRRRVEEVAGKELGEESLEAPLVQEYDERGTESGR